MGLFLRIWEASSRQNVQRRNSLSVTGESDFSFNLLQFLINMLLMLICIMCFLWSWMEF